MELNFDFKLSSDLVMQVLRFLDPVDILAMRATCKMFRRVSASRTVWIAALERVCEQHGIFKPTYPLDKMTCAELESAASGPHRFMQFISDSFQETHPKRAPSLTRQFPCWKMGTGSGFPERLHDVERLFIVPGGRFLLTAGDSLCLWDLGYSIATPMKPFPVASLPISLEPLFLTASPSVNGQELTIALVCRSSPDNKKQVTVFHADPLSSIPGFITQATLEFQTVSHSIASVHLLGDTAVIKSGHGIHVWNWVENTGCQWENSDADFYSQAVVVDQTVIAIDDFQNFLIWDIPPLIPVFNIEGQLAKVQNPEKRILQGTPQTEALGNDTVTISSGSVWQRHTQPHLCFTADELFRDWTGPKFLLHSLQRVGRPESPFLPSYMPVCCGTGDSVCDHLEWQIVSVVSPLYHCDGRLVMCCRSSEHELVAVSIPVPEKPSTLDIERDSALLVEGHDLDDETDPLDFHRVGFCPMSGRVVHTTSDTSIQVTDFLLPLPETEGLAVPLIEQATFHPPKLTVIYSRIFRETHARVCVFCGLQERVGVSRSQDKTFVWQCARYSMAGVGRQHELGEEAPHTDSLNFTLSPVAIVAWQFRPNRTRAPLSTLPPPPHTPPHCTGQDRVQLHAMVNNSNFKLSADLIMYVLRDLDPVDILAIRATCRMFYRIAASRSVWLAALDRVCEQHGIYKPTYPTEKMTIVELEHAASGPHRFAAWVKAYELASPSVCKGPHITRQFSSRRKASDVDSDPTGQISCLLIPGGRFLITAAQGSNGQDGEGTICLWDLGYGMHSSIKTVPIATTSIQPRPHSLTTCMSATGEGIILGILGNQFQSLQTEVTIMSIDPSHREPKFILLDERSAWILTLLKVFLCGDSVISMDDFQDFIIWNIPEHLPDSVPGEELIEVANSPKRFRRRHDGVFPIIYMATMPSFQGRSPPHLCIVVDEDNAGPAERKVFLYSVQKTGCQIKLFLPSHLPVPGGEGGSSAGGLGEIISYPTSPLFLCDGSLIMCCRSIEDNLLATVFPVPTEACEDWIQVRSACMVRGGHVDNEVRFDYTNVGFCPMSGRVVYPLDRVSLQLSDFLVPLERQ
ncbi:hypothetical protein NMY22_g1846 [Coprinellus aureogranulatus]|nr:hypothetical protein NMY22_g1846 [Coprinellus aureogranulatus]